MKKEKTETVIYLGPTITNCVAKATIFNNGISQELKVACEECPAISELIVPIAAAAKKNNEIALERGSTYEFYKKVSEFLTK